MKPLYLLLALLTIHSTIPAQTADEILTLTQRAYRELDNYVDQGTVVKEYFSTSSFKDTANYYLAMDRKQNVSHWLKFGKSKNITGAQFTKAAKDPKGTYTRLGTDDPSFTCTLGEAAARLGGAGGQMFFLFGSLMYPGFSGGIAGDSSAFLYYDKAKRLDDTTIHDMKCFVIKTRKTLYLSEESSNLVNFQRDSIQGLLDLPPEQRGGLRTVAGPKTIENMYYITIRDFMLVRKEEFSFKDNTNIITSKSTLMPNPKFNVKGFGKYLIE